MTTRMRRRKIEDRYAAAEAALLNAQALLSQVHDLLIGAVNASDAAGILDGIAAVDHCKAGLMACRAECDRLADLCNR